MLNQKQQKRELIRQNQQLKRQLEKSQMLIQSLYKQIAELKAQLSHYQQSSPKTPEPPKMTVQQHFQYSSGEQQEETKFSEQQQETPKQKVKFKNENLYQSASNGRVTNFQLRKTNTKIIFNSQQEVPRKSIHKVLKKSTEKKKNIGSTSERDISIRAASTKEISENIPLFLGKPFPSIRSEKLLFKKTSNSRSIFDHFFVTGTTKDGPSITYSYPYNSGHDFSGYLTLIYGQNYLKTPDLSPCNSRNKLNPNIVMRQALQQPHNKRQCFVVPIMKSRGQSAQRDYLIVCQIEQTVLQRPDKDSTPYFFSRYYCFLTQWKFFAELRKLCNLLIDRIQLRRRARQPANEVALGIQIGHQLNQPLNFLYQKSTDYNKTIDCIIGQQGLRFEADVPPVESSYQLVDRYLQNHLFSTTVYVKSADQQIQTKLFGVLMAYGLSQIKMVLYSNSKVRVSQCILQFLEVIRPLSYVNPIILSAIKEDHQTYLDAPMALILGLWNEHRRSNKQKIQIFMNKKLNLAGLIEKAKLNIADGVVINLDTGLVFGGAMNQQLNSIAQKLNLMALASKNSRNLRDYYKLIERLIGGRIESPQARSAWPLLMEYIRKTQLYCYYLQNRDE